MTQSQIGKYTLRMTPRRVLGWGFLALLLLGWMFVLGILVGRGTVSVPHKSQDLNRELAELKENALAKEREEIAAQARQSQEKTTELGFYKALKEPPPKPPVQNRPSPTPVKPKAAPAKSKETPASPTAAKEVPKPAENPKPAAKPASSASKPEAKPAAAAPVPAKAHYAVQVAAFRDLESASKLVAALRGKGYPAYQLRTEISAKEAWFRVRVGAFDNRPAADETLKKLQGENYKAVVVGTN